MVITVFVQVGILNSHQSGSPPLVAVLIILVRNTPWYVEWAQVIHFSGSHNSFHVVQLSEGYVVDLLTEEVNQLIIAVDNYSSERSVPDWKAGC